MGLRDLDIKAEYRTKLTNVPKEFIVPLLERSVSYKRAVGFFSSSALLEISKGIGALAKNGGRIRIIASPNLSQGDIDAINKGYREKREVAKEAIERELPDLSELTLEEKDRYNLLAYLIKAGILDFRIAFVDDSGGIGIYHEKLAIVEDADGDKVVFTGSMNESKTGMIDNYGAVDVFWSWNDPEHRIDLKEAAFEAIWNGYEIGIATYEFPEVSELIQTRYLVNEHPKLSMDKPPRSLSAIDIPIGPFGRPTLPDFDGFSVRPYQRDAVAAWVENNYRGLFDMATGTGKTITGLIALTKLFEDMYGDLAVIITCPYQHLVEQWLEDLELFGIKPIVAYSKSSQRDWKKRTKEAIFDRKLGLPDSKFFCCITTNATFATPWMQETLSKLKGNVLLLADEAHNLGAPGLQKLLDDKYLYRLALSATFSRHHDEEGTEVLKSFFGKTCIEYPLEKAIREGMLSEYRYYPIPVTLTAEELDEYQRLTKELGRCFENAADGTKKLSKRGELIALQRSRVVAAAANKLEALRQEIQPYRDKRHILVYCGAAQLIDADTDSSDANLQDDRQITHVVNMLGNDLGMSVSKFTSEEDIKERETLKDEFKKGNLQALVAIRCLDEGVNIPNIRTAFMLASTTNPKEYIQRRGRLLRVSEGKDYAEIYDFITLPYSTHEASGQTLDELRGVFTLINNETERGFEFAQYAQNFASAQKMLDEIIETYRLDELKLQIELLERETRL